MQDCRFLSTGLLKNNSLKGFFWLMNGNQLNNFRHFVGFYLTFFWNKGKLWRVRWSSLHWNINRLTICVLLCGAVPIFCRKFEKLSIETDEFLSKNKVPIQCSDFLWKIDEQSKYKLTCKVIICQRK